MPLVSVLTPLAFARDPPAERPTPADSSPSSGPSSEPSILQEAATYDEHRERRDRIAAIEKALAVAMTAAGYDVMNPINCRFEFASELFAGVRAAFAGQFPKLARGAER